MFRRIAVLTMVAWVRVASANDLVDLYQLARTHDATLAAAGSQRDAAIEARPQALASWLPQLGASANAGRDRAGYASGSLVSEQSAACEFNAVSQMQQCYGDVHGYGLTLSQTLWSFADYSRLKEANFQAASAEATLLGARQSLLLRLAQAYFAILAARDQLNTNQNERDAFGSLLSQAKSREQTGVGPRSDVEQAQSFYDATEENVIDARNALDDANLALTEIVGAHSEQLAPLREDIPLATPEPASAEDWVNSARQDNLDVRAAELKMEAAERDISVQRGAGLPTVSLSGTGSRQWQSDALGGNQNFDTVGVSFSWPLFQGGAVASAVRQSRALYRQSQALYDSTQRDAERLTRAAYRGVVSGVQRILASRRAVDSGQQAVEASRRNIEFNTGTEFDLLNAQNNYFSAQRSYNQARYDYLTNLLTLKQQAGRLAESDLAMIDALLVVHGS